MAVYFSFKQSAMETPIKVVEKGGYCFKKKKKISADVQVSDHAENLGCTAPSSVQFPPLIGLPTQCLLPIIAESQHRQARWQDGGPQLDRLRRASGQKIDWAGFLNYTFTGFVLLSPVVEEIKTVQYK